MRTARSWLLVVAFGVLCLLAVPGTGFSAEPVVGTHPAVEVAAQAPPPGDPGTPEGPELPLDGSDGANGLQQRTLIGAAGVALIVFILFGRKMRNKYRNKS